MYSPESGEWPVVQHFRPDFDSIDLIRSSRSGNKRGKLKALSCAPTIEGPKLCRPACESCRVYVYQWDAKESCRVKTTAVWTLHPPTTLLHIAWWAESQTGSLLSLPSSWQAKVIIAITTIIVYFKALWWLQERENSETFENSTSLLNPAVRFIQYEFIS